MDQYGMDAVPLRPDPRQRTLFDGAERREEAYLAGVEQSSLPPVAKAVARWIIEHGDRERRRVTEDGVGCQVLALPSRRRLAREAGISLGGASKAIARLEDEGLLWQAGDGRHVALNLDAFCETTPGATVGDEPIVFKRGRASDEQAEGNTHPPPRSRVFTGVHGCSRPSESEKEIFISPESPSPNRVRSEVVKRLDGAECRRAKSALNGSKAWQAITNADFAGGRKPSREKLRAAFRVARDAGLVPGDHDGKTRFLATVANCGRTARSPAGALVARVARGELHMAEHDDFQWAKQVLAQSQAVTGQAADYVAGLAQSLNVPG